MKIIFLLIFILSFNLKSQLFIDTVYSFTPGTLQYTGQSEEYYPMNIYGPPSIIATKYVQETTPEQILSLGLDGEIIVGLKNNLIINKPGPDFIIFENAFINQFNNKVYAEPAIVSVSKDGITFFDFPYNIDLLTGLAGVTPSIGKEDPFNYPACGGDTFDLSDLNIDSIRYIKIKDITAQILNNPKHPNYDPTLSGFDLDAVAIINHSDIINSVTTSNIISKNMIFDLFGNKIQNISNYNGHYFIVTENKTLKYVKIN